MNKIGLVETIEALRAELSELVQKAADQNIQFPVGGIELEFHVGVTHDAHPEGKLKFWVLELGGTASYAREAVQKVIINLEPPVDLEGRPIKVLRRSSTKP